MRPTCTTECNLPQRTIGVPKHTPFEFVLSQSKSEISRVDVFNDRPCQPCCFEVHLTGIGHPCHLDIRPIGIHHVRAGIFTDRQGAINKVCFWRWSDGVNKFIIPASIGRLRCIVHFSFRSGPAKVDIFSASKHKIWRPRC